MESNLVTQPLGSVAKVRSGFAFKSEDMGTVGLPVIKIKNVVPPSVDITDCERVPEEVIASIPKVERFELKEGDTLIAMTGATVGKVGRFPRTHPQERYFLNQRVGKVYLTAPESADYRYLYYVLSQDTYVRQMFGVADGSAQANISGAQIEDLEIPLPPLPEQKAIAQILGSLDDKIELNRRMNATLEAMARALFQSWFIDFDPVRWNMDRNQPSTRPSGHPSPNGRRAGDEGAPSLGIDKPTAALFPDSFQDSERGHVPYGWEVTTLGELVELAYGKPLKAEDRKPGRICVYGANGPVGWHDEKLVSGPGIVVGRKGNPGVVTWAHSDFYPIDTTFYIEPKGECRSLYFLFYALKNHDLANLSADSAVPGLNRNHAYMSKQVVPPQPILTAFDSLIAPIFTAIHTNEDQSRTLATLRDTLLPKLLSGELSGAALESRLEAAP